MTKNKNLSILSEAEKFALYGFPDFNSKQRREYFSFSKNEMLIIKRSYLTHINIYCALQIGYFKAKNMFFQFSLEHIPQEDVSFVLNHYFPDTKITKNIITKHEYYTQRQEITNLFGYQLWSTDFLQQLYDKAYEIIKLDITPNFIARELITFVNDRKIVRPAYTTLQTIVSKTLTNERNRISNIIDTELTNEYKVNLDGLMISEDKISSLAAFKQDPKNFGFKMMLKERKKHNILKPLYETSVHIVTKLEISKQNIQHYANLAYYYHITDLRKLQYNQNYLYILCYIIKRYQQINDNLIEAFIYHFKKLDKSINSKVKLNFQESVVESEDKVGNLLLLYVDDKIDDTSTFSSIRDTAFKILPKETIKSIAERMLNKSHAKKEFKWKEVDKLYMVSKKNLRPLFMKIDFSTESQDDKWLQSVKWLQTAFTNNQKLSKKPLSECPKDTIPKQLERYLLEENTNKQKSLNGDRYEHWIYSQTNKQISTGTFYIENSVNYRCFDHELVTPLHKKELLEKLEIPWLKQPINQRLNALTKELNSLWHTFNQKLKRNEFPHLKYDLQKQKLHWTKIKPNKDEKLQRKFFEQLTFCDISDVLNFANDNCNFLSAFTPLQPRYAKQEENLIDKIIATIIAHGFNHGNYKMSQISDISYRTLETIHQQYLRLSTLREANNILSKAISHLRIFPYYSLDLELLYSSVDGQKFELNTPNIKARYSRKYLREGQGVSSYTILANHIPLQCQLIGTHEHESYFVFDIWYNNNSSIIPEVITGDMHIINKANFATTDWFAVHLQPRFTNLNDQLKHLYCSNNIKKYKNYLIKPNAQIDCKLIIKQKPDIDRLVVSLALKDLSQANLIKKLCHLPSDNSLRKAVFEYDKLVRSIYTLKYIMDVQLQKNTHKSQNRVESYHQLRAAISKVGGKKQLYGKTDIDVEISNQCGRFIAMAIIYYNSVILSGVAEKHESLPNNTKALNKLKRISPISWHYHIHFLGQYTFQNKKSTININEILKSIKLI